MAASETVHAFLMQQFGVALEDIIDDASEGRDRPAIAGRVDCSAQRLDHWRDENGAVTELYDGVLTLDGVRYAWRASIFTDAEGERFVADVAEFKPLEWSARLRLVR